MTLHTRVIVTSPTEAPDVAERAVFAKMRELIGADESYTTYPDEPLTMSLGQGLPALMWVDRGDGVDETCDPEWCDSDCSGNYHDPAHFIEINFDTAYGYTAGNGAGCGDLHAYLVREVGAWLDERGLSWRWYAESYDGWNTTNDDLSDLGDPDKGRPRIPQDVR